MNILIFGDIHICLSSIEECTSIFDEIISLVNKYNVDKIISLGDNFDNTRPSPLELNCLANFIKKLYDKKIILLAAQSHESLTNELSSLDHYGILSDNVKVVKEFKDGTHLYCGHFSIKESLVNYGAKLSKENFKEYFYVFLGHIHSYYLIKPNIVHLGSCRYVNFEEAKDEQKIVALITDYGTEKENTHFLKLKSPIPMVQLELGQNTLLGGSKATSEAPIVVPESSSKANLPSFNSISAISAYLDKIDPNTKIKVKIMDFESFREFLPLVNRYSSKFHLFKYQTEFTVIPDNTQKGVLNETTSFKESFTKWLDQQNIDQKIKDILQKEVE
jgi:DNA repair exonuclease SbcCD nuclease subunit